MISCVEHESFGRYVVAPKNIRAGEIVLRENAYVYYPNNFSDKKNFCTHCCAPVPNDIKIICDTCESPYCSTECSSTHTTVHKTTNECAAVRLTKIAAPLVPKEDTDTFLTVALVIASCVAENNSHLLNVKADENKSFETVGLGTECLSPVDFLNNESGYQGVKTTFEHVQCLGTNMKSMRQDILVDFKNLFKVYTKVLRGKKAENLRPFFSTTITEEMYLAIACAYMCNGFGIWSSQGRKQGTAIFPLSSYFNHSCAPNLGRKNTQRGIEFFAARDIEQGETMCISYIDVKRPVAERIEKLKATYSFVCVCQRCQLPGDEADNLCNGLVPPLCEFCLSKVLQPMDNGNFICPCCNKVQKGV